MVNKVKCYICSNLRQVNDVLRGESLTTSTLALVQHDQPEFSDSDMICSKCLNRYRAKKIEEILAEEKGKITELEQEVVESIRNQEIISDNLNQEFQQSQSFGDKIADKVADFGGSWKFVIGFSGFIILWIVANSLTYFRTPADPYPFILLNLMLSCLAAMQAPIIMMSQNRQSKKDRLRAEMDYQVNLKAELQTRLMNRKIDQFMSHQWQKFLEIQQLQHQIANTQKK